MEFKEVVKLKVGTYILYSDDRLGNRARMYRVERVDRRDDNQTLKAKPRFGIPRWIYNHRIISLAENQK